MPNIDSEANPRVIGRHAGEPDTHWPHFHDASGQPILASPWVSESGHRACNAPYIVNGVTVGYCTVLVKKPHKGLHRVEFA
jgi:hypothetical protein